MTPEAPTEQSFQRLRHSICYVNNANQVFGRLFPGRNHGRSHHLTRIFHPQRKASPSRRERSIADGRATLVFRLLSLLAHREVTASF